MTPLISIIIVTWNCREYVLSCLETIFLNPAVSFEIIVRDNGSNDGTIQAIQENFPQVRLLGDGLNVGFAAANNEAIEQAMGRYLMLLNPDTKIAPTVLTGFLQKAQSYDQPVMLVPTLLNPDGTVQPSHYSFPTLAGLLKKVVKTVGKRMTFNPTGSPNLSVDWAIAACWFMPKPLYQAVQGLDENFFMYGEDLDFCWRVWQAGFQIVLVPDIEVTHFGNVSGQQKWGNQRLSRTYRSLVYFWMKHFAPLNIVIMMLVRLAYLLVGGLVDFVKRLFTTGSSPARRRAWPEEIVAFSHACLDRAAWRAYLSTHRHAG